MRVAAVVVATALGVGLGGAGPVAAATRTTSVTVNASAATVITGGTVTVRGKVAPSARRTVVLQHSVRGRWVALDRRATTTRGAYTFRVAVGTDPRTVRLRVKAPRARAGAHTYRPATSRVVAVTVATPVEPEPQPGSLRSPYAVDETFRLVSWRISLGATDLDAWPEIEPENMFNEPPGPGWSYVMVPVTLENVGSTELMPWLDLSIEYLGGDGVVYGASSGDQWCGVVPDQLSDVNDVYPGGRVTGNQCAAVPTEAVAGGHWRVTTYDAGFNRRSAFVAIA